MPLEVSLVLRYLHQVHKEPLKRLQEMYPQYTRTTLYRHCIKPISETEKVDLRRKTGKGKKRKLTPRDERKLVSALLKLRKTEGNFCSTDIQKEAGLSEKDICNRTVRRALNRMGYRYSQCRRKGQLIDSDLTRRLAFAKQCKKLPQTFWQQGVGFYLDGTGWVHKTNPSQHARTARSRTWKKRGESLNQYCTAKGKKEGVGGTMAKFMVAISYGHGVIKCQQYTGQIDGEKCAKFVEKHFPEMFENSSNPKGKLFLQDGDPSQNSVKARTAMEKVGCRLFKIPARSPDLNPIENIFHLIGKEMKREAKEENITQETYDQFCARAKRTVLNFSPDIIDKTIDSMPRRIEMVIKNNGNRTKY